MPKQRNFKKRILLLLVCLAILSTLRIAMAERTPLSFRLDSALYGKASWYSRYSPGINKHTANNERFDDQDMTCAIWGIGFNRQIRVTNINNGKSIIVRVNDRGPHRRLVLEGRIIDLTKSAFQKLAPTRQGLIDVKIELL
jgi:rare lipoprotein A